MDLPAVYKEIGEVSAEYSYSKPPELLLMLQRFWRSVLRLVNDILASLHISFGASTDSRGVSNVLLAVVLLLGAICVVVIVVAIWLRVGQIKRGEKKAKLRDTTTVLLTAEAWRNEAERLAGEKEWKEACRASYFAFLRGLDEKGVLPFSPTRSNYEYYYALSRKSNLAKAFKRLADVVEEEWFGNRVATEEDFAECSKLAAQVSILEDKSQLTQS